MWASELEVLAFPWLPASALSHLSHHRFPHACLPLYGCLSYWVRSTGRTSFFLTFYWFFVNFTPRTPTLLISPPLISTLHPCNLSSSEGKKVLLCKLQCVTACPTVHPSAHTSLLADGHCNGSLCSYEAPGFCYPINTGAYQDFLLDLPLLLCVMELL